MINSRIRSATRDFQTRYLILLCRAGAKPCLVRMAMKRPKSQLVARAEIA
jgi:hypothetical protein